MTSAPNSSPRDCYRAALAASFGHSGRLAEQTGRRAEQLVDTPEFDRILAAAQPMSLEAARRIGDLAVVYLSAVAVPGPWWRELLAYERAHFLQAASTDQRLVTYLPRRGVAATTVNFTWDLPLLLQEIESATAGQRPTADDQRPPAAPHLRPVPHPRRSEAEPRVGTDAKVEVADIPHRSLTLLFSRAPDGRVCVVELEKPVAAVFRMTNGMRKKEQIADAAGLPLPQTEEILYALARIGAVENV